MIIEPSDLMQHITSVRRAMLREVLLNEMDPAISSKIRAGRSTMEDHDIPMHVCLRAMEAALIHAEQAIIRKVDTGSVMLQ